MKPPRSAFGASPRGAAADREMKPPRSAFGASPRGAATDRQSRIRAALRRLLHATRVAHRAVEH